MIPIETEDKYPAFGKIPRLNREFWITEKIDGTNGLIEITAPEGAQYPEEYVVRAGSRNRWLTPEDDNFGFAAWVREREMQLALDLGIGKHYGEFYGRGIQRTYGLEGRRFALFNARRWNESVFETDHLEVVPVVSVADVNLSFEAHFAVEALREFGSLAVDGWPTPEGVVIFHVAAQQTFKVTLDKDAAPKGAELPAVGALQQASQKIEAPKLYVPGTADFPGGLI